jgi:hypothetical protein
MSRTLGVVPLPTQSIIILLPQPLSALQLTPGHPLQHQASPLSPPLLSHQAAANGSSLLMRSVRRSFNTPSIYWRHSRSLTAVSFRPAPPSSPLSSPSVNLTLTVHVIRYWEVLFSDPSETVATGRAAERYNLLDYLTDEVSISGDDSGEGRKSLTTCASALSALLMELPNAWTHQPPLLFPEVTSSIASCAVRNLTTLFLCDTISQRILVSLPLPSLLAHIFSPLHFLSSPTSLCSPEFLNFSALLLRSNRSGKRSIDVIADPSTVSFSIDLWSWFHNLSLTVKVKRNGKGKNNSS